MNQTAPGLEPFRIGPRSTDARGVQRFVFPAVNKALGLASMNRLYDFTLTCPPEMHFSERALRSLNVTSKVPQEDLARIPKTGPLVVVANHPFGGLEGIILAAMLRRVRPDVKLLANYMLSCIPEFRDSFFFVDPFGRGDSARKNIASMRAAVEWVRQGHVLGVFPAGEVSHLKIGHGVTDPPWSTTISRLIQRAGAAVAPVYFEGRNSGLFQLLGLVHPRLRTIMLPHELLRRKNTSVSVRIGSVIESKKIAQLTDPQELIDYLRVRTYILKTRPDAHGAKEVKRNATAAAPVPVAPARTQELTAGELAALPPRQILMESGEYLVGYFHAEQAPNALYEVGRLRELSFRGVGEGTGRELDLDWFDDHYLHLFVWHRKAGELVGGYRMGPTDQILAKQGKRGLYTSTLFSFSSSVLREMGPALELGRSFVRPEYQRAHMPLMLLWRGIGKFVARNPQYNRLFGVVSISNSYASMSQQLLTEFLHQNHYLAELGKHVRPRTPPRRAKSNDWSDAATNVAVRDLANVDELIAEIEPRFKAAPILLRQYLKLQAKLVGMNVDAQFGNVLDALMLVDLVQADRIVLGRYIGDDTDAFIEYHRKK